MNIHLNDVFHTIQGEGANAGRRALFVRMPYCNLACPWCDTSFDSHREWSELEFLRFTQIEDPGFAVVTGGEPAMHKHTPRVVELLKSVDYEVAIETNGNFPIPTGIDFVTVSPKRYHPVEPFYVHPGAMAAAHEFKYVVEKGFDFHVLDRHDTSDGRRYSLSPEWNRFSESITEILTFIKENPKWRISVQTHKWINVP